jgi:hypothetical protein
MGWPYPSENQDPWFDALEQMIAATDVSAYASREDRNTICFGGGTVSFNTASNPNLTWSAPISLLSPVTGFLWTILAGSANLADGQVLYADLVRAPTSNQVVTTYTANQVANSDTAYLLAIRIGSTVFFRTSSLASGSTQTGFYSSGGGAVDPRWLAYDISGEVVGSPVGSQTCLNFVSGRTVTFPANFAGSVAKAGTTATGSAQFVITKNSSNVGTITFAAGSGVATMTSSGGAPVVLASGDILNIYAPAVADATLADVTYILVGSL